MRIWHSAQGEGCKAEPHIIDITCMSALPRCQVQCRQGMVSGCSAASMDLDVSITKSTPILRGRPKNITPNVKSLAIFEADLKDVVFPVFAIRAVSGLLPPLGEAKVCSKMPQISSPLHRVQSMRHTLASQHALFSVYSAGPVHA